VRSFVRQGVWLESVDESTVHGLFLTTSSFFVLIKNDARMTGIPSSTMPPPAPLPRAFEAMPASASLQPSPNPWKMPITIEQSDHRMMMA